MKGIFKRSSAGVTGKVGEKVRERHGRKKASTTRKRYLLRS
jgi:hypothetical protein